MLLKRVDNIGAWKVKFFREFEKLSRDNLALYKLLYETSRITNVFIVGGFLRSVANNLVPRDLDVIINLETRELEETLNRLNLSFDVNKLNGFKIHLKTVKVDFWTVDNNWAFKSNLISNAHTDLLHKIAQGTFFDFDSLVFDLYSENCNFKYYNDCIKSNSLGIIRRSSRYMYTNPGKLNNVIRAFYIRMTYKLDFSIPLCEYIETHLNNLGIIHENSIVEHLIIQASKIPRFDKLDRGNIQESIHHYKTQLQENKRNGGQLNLFR